MPHIQRQLDLFQRVDKKSHFLFGPRQTGKSTLIEKTLPKAKIYNLLDTTTFLNFTQNPSRLSQEIGPKDTLVVIDEIQRIPDLLNEVQLLIDKKKTRFLLTGSSARKIRRGGINLLGGRARVLRFHPFIRQELGSYFTLSKALQFGLIPSIYFSDNPKEDLKAYCGSYLQEEIVAEAATRNVPAFSRFLRMAALCNGTIVNFTNIANDAQVKRTTVYEYFDILKDTLILEEVPAWKASKKRKPLHSSKFYFFDIGVVHALQERTVSRGTPEFGAAFETYLFHELAAHRDYKSGEPIGYWRSKSGFEVDFILGDHTAIEVKAKTNVSLRDLKSLKAIKEEKKFKNYICVSLEKNSRQWDGIHILPYHEFLEEWL